MINVPYSVISERIIEKTGISEADLESKVKAKLEQLSGLISKEGAAHIVANELGINLLESQGDIKIKGLLSGMRDVDVVGKVLKKYDVREFNTQRGQGKLGKFLFADETGTSMVVMWNKKADHFSEFKDGDVIRITSASVRDNNGRKEIHLSDDSNIEVNPSGVTVNVERSGDYSSGPAPVRKKISELNENDSNVEIFSTVVQVFDPKFFEVDPSTGKRIKREEGQAPPADATYGAVLNIFADDGSDNTRVVLWKNQILNLLGVDEAKLMDYRVNPETFESVKTELLGLMGKFSGRVVKNDLFGRLEFVANRVDMDVNPEEEIKKIDSSKEKTASVSEEPVKKEESDELLSLEDLEDLDE